MIEMYASLSSDVFTDECDLYAVRGMRDALDDVFPSLQIERLRLQSQPCDDGLGEPLAFEIERHFVDRARIAVLYDVARRYVAKKPDLLFEFERDELLGIGAQNDRVG